MSETQERLEDTIETIALAKKLCAKVSMAQDFWRAEYYKAKADNVALHKGIRRLKKVEHELRMRLYDASQDVQEYLCLVGKAERLLEKATGCAANTWKDADLSDGRWLYQTYLRLQNHPHVLAFIAKEHEESGGPFKC